MERILDKDVLDELLPGEVDMVKKILVVDDEKDWAHAFALALEEHGYKITAAFEPLQAITQIKESKPDLVLLDLLMPAGGGFSVLQHIRETGDTIILPVIIISVQDDAETKKKAEEMGISAYFVKPVVMKELVPRINEILKPGLS